MVGEVIKLVSNHIAISGHTDAEPFSGGPERSNDNWRLSSARADSARRTLLTSGVDRHGSSGSQGRQIVISPCPMPRLTRGTAG